MGKQRRLTKEEKEEAVRLYVEDQLSSIEVGKRLNVSKAAILQLLRYKNIKRRTIGQAKRLYGLNEGAFSEVTEPSAYWIGFLMADGCVAYRPEKKAPEIKLSLGWKDRKHIKLFKDFLETQKPYRDCISNDGFKYRQFEVTSSKMADDLAKYGVVPRKSHIATVSKALINNRHFWRGVVDGDGCVNKIISGLPRLSVVGSKSLMTQFLDFCKGITPTTAKVGRHANIFRVQIAGSHAMAVMKQLYDNCNVYLSRKHKKAHGFLNG
jgi:hypothetical protein